MDHNVAALVRLMLVTDDALVRGQDLIQLAIAAERGGISSFQLRLKQPSARELAELTRALVAALQVPVLVNDRPDIALAAGAAGVHLGPDDLSIDLARRIAPSGFIIGASVGSEMEAAKAAKADYWGIGPWRATATKGDAGSALGPDDFTRLTRLAGHRPCMAIGSIRPDDLPVVLSRGGSGVAVASGILAGEDVEVATRQYARQWGSWPRAAAPPRAPDLSDGP
jgi:thiamine-phosphate pyrophosphorylase